MKPNRKFVISVVVFSLIIIVSNMVYYRRPNPYVRPNLYFYLLSLAVGVVAFQVPTPKLNRFMKVVIFLEILIITLSFTSTQQALYKTVLSRDPWTHGALISQIIKNHHIPDYQSIKIPYVWLPNFHLTIIYLMETSTLSYKWSAYFLGFVSFILVIITAYIFSTRVWELKKFSMLPLLLIGISDNVLDMMGRNIVPNSTGVAIAFLVLLILIRESDKNRRLESYLVLMLLFFGLAFMHTLSYGFVITEILIIIATLLIFCRERHVIRHFSMLFGISWIIALLVWGLISQMYLKSFTMLVRGFFVGIEIVENYPQKVQIPLETIILSRIGMLVYFGLVGLGILMFIWHLSENLKTIKGTNWNIIARISYTGVSFWTLAMSFSFLLPSWAGIAHRFWYYGEVLGGIFVTTVSSSIYKRRRKMFLASVIAIVIMSYLMFTASVSNDDNPLIKGYSTRTGWYDSELTAGLFVLDKVTSPVASDWDYISSLNSLLWTKINEIPASTPKLSSFGWVLTAEFPKDFSEITEEKNFCFILRRKFVVTNSFWLGPRWGMKLYNPISDSTSPEMKTLVVNEDIIYNSGTTQIMG
ncbi:hypothetical protein E3E38_04570 [Thermococcus sp. 18S1]|uniref:hypothetical protein n=1 Tax=Thermococcus sp. 18S1 TaxID=1638210 RepID=UPI0014390518|nr:hypothetical protein [Thermococcus sp. 18S1]NJE30327.1 hypothetical protein [Thermococcus sp. 18S1]